jgi:hypothetical protein
MNIQNQNNSPTFTSFYEFVVLAVIKEEVFTLSVYAPTILGVQTTITRAFYRELIPKTFVRFGSVRRDDHRAVYHCKVWSFRVYTRNLFD